MVGDQELQKTDEEVGHVLSELRPRSLVVPLLVDDDYPNITLARRGYLGTTPRSPNVAIAFNVLEAYRQLHRVCPKLSVYAQVQALCYIQRVSAFAHLFHNSR